MTSSRDTAPNHNYRNLFIGFILFLFLLNTYLFSNSTGFSYSYILPSEETRVFETAFQKCTSLYMDVGDGESLRIKQFFGEQDGEDIFGRAFQKWFGDADQRKKNTLDKSICVVSFSTHPKPSLPDHIVSYDNVVVADNNGIGQIDIADWFRRNVLPLQQLNTIVLGIGKGVNIAPILARLTNSAVFCAIDQTVLSSESSYVVPNLDKNDFLKGIEYFWSHRGDQCKSSTSSPPRLISDEL